SPPRYPVGPGPNSSVVADFNDDGYLDLAVADEREVSIFLGRGDGTFALKATCAVMSEPSSIVAGDFNSDGRLDLAVTNTNWNDSTVSVLLGDGDGTFAPQVTYAAGRSPDAIVVGDFDGDGHLDLAVTASGEVSVLLGRGDGTFAPLVTYAVG